MARRDQMNFTVSGETLATFENLKRVFDVETNTAVLRRALAIAKLCGNHQREDRTVSIQGSGEAVVVVLNA